MEAIVLAGGLGTRLRSVVSELPKAMAPVNGRPFLEYQLLYLKHYGVRHVVLSVGYMHYIIEEHFGAQWNGLEISYAIEEEPLGTGGGIALACNKLHGQEVLALNGDTIFQVDLTVLKEKHIQYQSAFTMALRSVDDVERFGTVKVDEMQRITGFAEKGKQHGSGVINGGIYLFDKSLLLDAGLPGRFSLEKDFFEKQYNAVAMYGVAFDAYFLDIGVPDDFKKAQDEFKRLKY